MCASKILMFLDDWDLFFFYNISYIYPPIVPTLKLFFCAV